jgi:V8-like Glu-specific endopeptidase
MKRSVKRIAILPRILDLRYLAALTSCATGILACSSAPAPSESSALVEQKVIFGPDDFREVGSLSVGDPKYRQVRATASAFVRNSVLCDEVAGTCQLPTQPFAFENLTGSSHGATPKYLPICEGERFSGQPQGSYCTAFLIGENLAVTAGHCVQSQADCDAMTLVFGFMATDEAGQNVNTTVPMSDVYSCHEVIAAVSQGSKISDTDFALIRLDRNVTDRQPVEIRTSGAIADGASVYAVGGYHGLPLKISGNAVVKNNPLSQPRFETNLDAGKGSSGCPVFNESGVVEGILVSGPVSRNYEIAQAADGTECARAIRCDDVNGCNTPSSDEGELDWVRVTRISNVVDVLQGRSCFDHQLGPDETDVDCGGPKCAPCLPSQVCNVDSDCRIPGTPGFRPACWQAPHCDAGRCTLDLSTCECRVDADCHDGLASTADKCTEYNSCWHQLRGDANWDGTVSIVDALAVAQYAQNLNPQPFLPLAADVNCDGTIDEAGDAQLIARYSTGLLTQFPCAD